ARPGSGPEVLGSRRHRPSKSAPAARMSAWPVRMAGSSDSGSAPLMMTRSARCSLWTQPTRGRRVKTRSAIQDTPGANLTSQRMQVANLRYDRLQVCDTGKRRNFRRGTGRKFGRGFIAGYLGALVVAGTLAPAAGGRLVAADVALEPKDMMGATLVL